MRRLLLALVAVGALNVVLLAGGDLSMRGGGDTPVMSVASAQAPCPPTLCAPTPVPTPCPPQVCGPPPTTPCPATICFPTPVPTSLPTAAQIRAQVQAQLCASFAAVQPAFVRALLLARLGCAPAAP